MAEVKHRPAFGELLREFRVVAGLSQEVLAERARLSVDGISALERGINKAPQRETLALLVEALHLEPHQRQLIEAAATRHSSPRARARASRKNNLPRVLAPLFGRERDLVAVLALVKESRIVTLTGAGGVGKTRLAIETGLAALRDFPDGVWFVDLAPVRDVDGTASALAATFGIRQGQDLALLDTVADALARKSLLVVLDNCEHLVTAVSVVIKMMVDSCPQLSILATSRQPLHVTAEQIYRVTSLDSSASVALFLDAARRADASFLPEESELLIVESLGRRLDGIALAIELAAARVKLLSVAQIEELLAERFRLLTGGDRLTRHRTMHAVVDWSYDLLSAEERALFNRLGVFDADFTFEAARAICAGGEVEHSALLDLLGSLVDKSLVTSERHARARRFRLLETMRAYAMEKLGTAIGVLRRRHADYFAALAQSTQTSDTSSPSFESEYENFRQTFVWSIDESGDVALGIRLLATLREFLLLRGLAAESARRAERALQSEAALEPSDAAMAWETLAALLGDLLLPARAFEAVNHALEIYERLDDRAGLARAFRHRGIAYMRMGSFAKADDDLQRALELSRAYGNPRDLARTLGSIALIYGRNGKLEESRAKLLEVLEMARSQADERIVWVTLMNLAEAEFALGESASAASRLEELLASKMACKNVRLRANSESNLAAYLIALHRDREAEMMARAAVFDARESGDTGIMSCALGHLAALLATRDVRSATRLLGYVESIFASGYHRERTERFTYELLMTALRVKLSEDEIAELAREGASMNEAQAIRLATRPHHL